MSFTLLLSTLLSVYTFTISSRTLLFFFFLMIRRPPRSTLFPTRRSSDLRRRRRCAWCRSSPARCRPYRIGTGVDQRSEEHTSELQSQSNLVCRLLLEKKKTTSRTLI